MIPLVRIGVALCIAGAGIAAGQPVNGAEYLIFCPDAWTDAVRPLADWKTAKGVPARIVPLSECGRAPADVRDYILDAWQNWPVPPRYVLIACPPDTLPGHNYEDDTWYGDLAGDYPMELPVGRFPARTMRECSTMVARTLAWDRSPSATDTLPWLKGTTIVCDRDSPPDRYYTEDQRHVRALWNAAGYVLTESLSSERGDSARHAIASVHDGRTFLTYRGAAGGGWDWTFHNFWPFGWQNSRRTPIIVSATCATVTLAPGEWMLGDVCLGYGSPESLGGAVAFYGTTVLGSGISAQRSAAYRGLMDAIFIEGEYRLGPATLRSRFRVDSLFHQYERYYEWCLLGDPELSAWTGVPRAATVACDSTMRVGQSFFAVRVELAGQPVRGALVCASIGDEVYARDTTDAAGNVLLAATTPRPGTLLLVVTGRNLRPVELLVPVVATGGPWVAHRRSVVNDTPPGGNGDRSPGPGETFALETWVANYGDSAAVGVTGLIATDDTLVQVLDSTASLGALAPGDSAWTGDSFRLRVLAGCPDGHVVALRLTCRDARDSSWLSLIRLTVGAPDLRYRTYDVFDGANERVDPEETAELGVTLWNEGHGTASGSRAVLRSTDPHLVVVDSLAWYGEIVGHTASRNDSDRFTVRAGLIMPGTAVECTLAVSAAGFNRRLPFTITVGRTDTCDPVGDRPGHRYWAYDDCDRKYRERPDYDWQELRGVGTRLELGDNQTVTIPLPVGFGPFTCYDRQYREISICSNGWLAPGAATGNWWQNRRLPDALFGPMIAAHWDDYYPPFGGGVWYYRDEPGHRFVVEWDSVHYRNPVSQFETFQFVLYDSTLAAADGNSEFAFQFRTARHVNASTVGIQDSAGSRGMTLVCDASYDSAAAAIRPGRAVKFTTDAPVYAVGEPGGSVPVSRPPAGIVRGVLQLPAGAVRVFDAGGRCVLRCEAGPAGRRLDVGGLSPGVYFVVGDGAGPTRRVVIVR